MEIKTNGYSMAEKKDKNTTLSAGAWRALGSDTEIWGAEQEHLLFNSLLERLFSMKVMETVSGGRGENVRPLPSKECRDFI